MPLAVLAERRFFRPARRCGNLIPIYDPTTGLPFAKNSIPADRINAVSKKFQDKFYPLPNRGDPNVFPELELPGGENPAWNPCTYMVGRIDHRFSDKDSIYGRITGTSARNDMWEGNLPTVGQRNQHRVTRAVNITHTHTFSPIAAERIPLGHEPEQQPHHGPHQRPATHQGTRLDRPGSGPA